jgi:hypothetical protein
VLRRSSVGARTAGQRTYRRSITCAAHVRRGSGEARGAGQSRHLGSGNGLGKARDLGRRVASAGGGLRRGRRGGARRGRDTRRGSAPADTVTVYSLLKLKISIFLNTSAQIFEYESRRFPYPLQLSQRPYGVFLNIFCTHGLPTLNATHIQ